MFERSDLPSYETHSSNKDLLGVVIGVAHSGYIVFEGREPVGLGEYVIIANNDKKKNFRSCRIMFY